MPSKRRVRNNLRYYAYWQRLVQVSQEGSIFEDYRDLGGIYCDKRGVRSFELYKPEADRIEGKYKVQTRLQLQDFNVNDRLLFLNDDDFTKQVQLATDQILRVESTLDKTGRRERVNLECVAGAFAGEAPVEPLTGKQVVFKGAISSLSVLMSLTNSSQLLYQEDYTTLDVLVDKYKNPWLFNDETSRIPVIISLNSGLEAPTIELEDGSKQTMNPYTHPTLKIFTLPALPSNQRNLKITLA